MKLYVEHIDGVPLTPKEQEGVVFRSDLREAKEQEIKDAKEHFTKHGACKYHLVYDKPGFDYDMRYCGICNSFICLM